MALRRRATTAVVIQRRKAFCVQPRQRIDRARAVGPRKRRIPDLHQHSQLGVITGTLQTRQIELRVISQRKRYLAQFFVQKRINLAARRRIGCYRCDQSRAEQSSKQRDQQTAAYRESAHQSSV